MIRGYTLISSASLAAIYLNLLLLFALLNSPARQEENRNQKIEFESSRLRLFTDLTNSEVLAKRDVDVVCSGNDTTTNPVRPLACAPFQARQRVQSQQKSAIEVYIKKPNNSTSYDLGSSLTIECRFNTLLNQDLKFNLRWLRSVDGALGNQSITATDTDDSSSTLIAATTRVWTAQRNGGLDLELNNFQMSDVGDYFCQALSIESANILSEAHIHLTASPKNEQNNANQLGRSFSEYSQEALANLLPSLRVVPEFSELSPGASLQLICYTTYLDPDPEGSELEWSFESIDRLQLTRKAPISMPFGQLPHNTTIIGNALMIWFLSEEHAGIYKCTQQLIDFDLSVQASAMVSVKSIDDSAPLVFVTPELIRLSPNGSATIQCETTGYPPPDLIWYRVEDLTQLQKSQLEPPEQGAQTDSKTMFQDNQQKPLTLSEGVELEYVMYKDVGAFCDLNRCHSTSTRNIQNNKVRQLTTGVSLLHLKQARAEQQGQYVCRAHNKHGSNQASSLVDVEFREPPVVNILPTSREQTIELKDDNNTRQMNVTFRCRVELGRPLPRLRWLRTSSKSSLMTDNLDIYDLTKISSATSNISTVLEDKGRSLVLTISTISLNDEGNYVCLGENEWGRHSEVAHLSVYRPSAVRIVQTSPLIAHPNESFHLDCIASGHPTPLDIEWSRYDRGAFFSLISRTSSAIEGNQDRAILKFDRITQDEAGEYTCNARSALNHTDILRDTIMVLVEPKSSEFSSTSSSTKIQSQRPKLMVRPTKASVVVGSNLTIDCLAVSGLQPTIVEWIAPPLTTGDYSSNELRNSLPSTYIRPYYLATGVELRQPHQVLQFGSKLKIFNISKAHEGVYQCKGRNKIDVESAPALVRVFDSLASGESNSILDGHSNPSYGSQSKTKVAMVGSNIELKCQVNGMEQPVTSWSREGLELPSTSVQIGHNLWIQNVTGRDDGLYICSVRSAEPNKVIQAKINLLVRDMVDALPKLLHNLTAKIIASKSVVNLGDSITLECIVDQLSPSNKSSSTNEDSDDSRIKSNVDLEEIERSIVWTNLHSGQTLFQDNVYIQNNLLIIYELRAENSATYRCNFNDLRQYTDYRLQVFDSSIGSDGTEIGATGGIGPNLTGLIQASQLTSVDGRRVELRQVSVGSQVTVTCPKENYIGSYHWTRGYQQQVGKRDEPLIFESIRSEDADIYYCHLASLNEARSVLVHVLVPVARFLQRPVSFISLPSISGADQQLDIEIKFLAEKENGLILFNGQNQASNRTLSQGGDYISLGLNRGYLEFRFELGDGTTLLRSLQPLYLNVWNKVVIERNRRGAVMWVNKQPPVSNSSSGKFFNLNLDSVLYVGGNQYFQNRSRFYGYSRGFQGCISLLRIANQEIDLMARNRSVTVGIYECDKTECKANLCGQQNGLCQVDRPSKITGENKLDPTRRTSTNLDTRCICMPGFTGSHCEKIVQDRQTSVIEEQTTSNYSFNLAISTAAPPNIHPKTEGSCEIMKPCASEGTVECQSLTTTSYKCHCAMGFVGDTCSRPASFSSETSVWFNQQAYLKFRFNKPEEAQLKAQQQQKDNTSLSSAENFNLTNYVKLSSMIENQEIAFKLRTKANYGLIFYTGQATVLEQPNVTFNGGSSQTTKSVVANLLMRLSNIVFDYLAVALVDGHIELSYELGSGVSIIRSSNRVNDGKQHLINVMRNGKFARLTIDETYKHEGSSPGKLSMLNSQADIYLGGLPYLAELTNNMYMSGFEGCLTEMKINSLGPLNLLRSDHLTQIQLARNLAPCSGSEESTTMPAIATSSSSMRPKPKPYQTPPSSLDSDDTEEM